MANASAGARNALAETSTGARDGRDAIVKDARNAFAEASTGAKNAFAEEIRNEVIEQRQAVEDEEQRGGDDASHKAAPPRIDEVDVAAVQWVIAVSGVVAIETVHSPSQLFWWALPDSIVAENHGNEVCAHDK